MTTDPFLALHIALGLPPDMTFDEQAEFMAAKLTERKAKRLAYRFASKVWLVDDHGVHAIDPEFYEPDESIIDCTHELNASGFTFISKPPSSRVSVYKDGQIRRMPIDQARDMFTL